MATISDAIKYGESAIACGDVYVFGANGEKILDLLPSLTSMEKVEDVKRILTLISRNVKNGKDIYKMRGEDCSGLWVKFLMESGIIKKDMTANGLYEFIGNPISIKNVKKGDFVFHGSSTNKSHIGLYIGDGYVIESKGRDFGVVKTSIGSYNWNYAARPKFWDAEIVTLTRELKLVEGNYMNGEDVKAVQTKLKELGNDPGKVDGVYGPKTEQAVIDFQVAKKLKKVSYGTVDKTTAIELGFAWKK